MTPSPDAASDSDSETSAAATHYAAATAAEKARNWDLILSLSQEGDDEKRQSALAKLSMAIPFLSLERINDIASAVSEYEGSVEDYGLTGLISVYGKKTHPSWSCNLCGQNFPDRSLEAAVAHLSPTLDEGVEKCAAIKAASMPGLGA